MIPAFVFWLYKKFAAYPPRKRKSIRPPEISNILATAIFLIILPLALFGEEKTSIYVIKHNGRTIGQLLFSKRISGQDVYLKMSSNVKTRFIFGIDIKTIDQAHFRNGMLVNSNVYRSVNGKEKENKKTCLVNNNYQVRSGDKISWFDPEIRYNMMMLYDDEPLNVSQVYSDNFQQFIAIQRAGPHIYRLNLPDGNYNDYHFKNGVCKLVELHHSMYIIKMELT